MMDSIHSAVANIYRDTVQPEGNRKDEIASPSMTIKGGFGRSPHQISQVQNNVINNCCAMSEVYNYQNSNDVSGLILILRTINKLKSEMTGQIYNRLTNVYSNDLYKKNQHGDEGDSEHSEKELGGLPVEVAVDAWLKMLLVKIQLCLFENGMCQSFTIITFYQLQLNARIVFKQLLAIVPYENDNPQQTVSEITTLDIAGHESKLSLPTTLVQGKHEFTKDWLSISKRDGSEQNAVQELYVKSNKKLLRGFTLKCEVNGHQKSVSNRNTLYVPGFTDCW